MKSRDDISGIGRKPGFLRFDGQGHKREAEMSRGLIYLQPWE